MEIFLRIMVIALALTRTPTWKFVIIGDYSVGKTSLCKVFSGGSFVHEYKPTIGVDIFIRTIPVVEGIKITYQIWDLAGQKRFHEVMGRYYNGAKGGAAVFDITRLETFENIPEWVEHLRENIDNKNIPLILVGNKVDLEDKRIVSREEAEELAKELKLIGYIEASAKQNLNVEEVFKAPFRTIVEKYKKLLSRKSNP